MQDRFAGASQIQTGNRLNYQHITQVKYLGHSCSSWREEEALGLLQKPDGVPAAASQRETPPGLRETATYQLTQIRGEL
jgi:hypothetical protein